MQPCAFCQGEVDPATLICRACGQVQPHRDDDITLVPPAGVKGELITHCRHCNERLPVSARFCGRCGQPVIPLAEETAGMTLHDTSALPARNPRDDAITDVLKRPIRLADMPTQTPGSLPERGVVLPGAAADTAAEPPKVPGSGGRVEGSVPPRKGMETRQGRSGVAHGLRYRLLSRMQARIVVAALMALLITVGVAGSQTGILSLPRYNAGEGTVTPVYLLSPTGFAQACHGIQALADLMGVFDNTGSTVGMFWQVQITQSDPKGRIWARATPSNGTLPAGQKATLVITPISTLCQDVQGSDKPMTYTLTVKYVFESGQFGKQEVTDTVIPPD